MLRPLLFALLTAWIATLTALHVSAGVIIEPPFPARAVLDWTTSDEALQTRLHKGFSALVAREPWRTDPSVFESNFFRHALNDGSNRIECLSTGIDSSNSLEYRCEFDLVSPYMSWTTQKNSIPALLFDAMESLLNKNTVSGLYLHETKDSRIVGLLDPMSSSQIVCEKNKVHPSTSHVLYRCQINIRP